MLHKNKSLCKLAQLRLAGLAVFQKNKQKQQQQQEKQANKQKNPDNPL